MNGAIFIARKSVEGELWRNKPAAWWKIWCFILLSVQHKQYKELKRGQGYFNFREIIRMKYLGEDITYSQVDHFLRNARSGNMLATQKATHGTLITVLNYAQYQDKNYYLLDLEAKQKANAKAKQKRNESDNINNNDNNDNSYAGKSNKLTFNDKATYWDTNIKSLLEEKAYLNTPDLLKAREAFCNKANNLSTKTMTAFIKQEIQMSPPIEKPTYEVIDITGMTTEQIERLR